MRCGMLQAAFDVVRRLGEGYVSEALRVHHAAWTRGGSLAACHSAGRNRRVENRTFIRRRCAIHSVAFSHLCPAPLWGRRILVARLGARQQLGPPLLSSICPLCLFAWPVSVRSRSCSSAGLFQSDCGLALLYADVLDSE